MQKYQLGLGWKSRSISDKTVREVVEEPNGGNEARYERVNVKHSQLIEGH